MVAIAECQHCGSEDTVPAGFDGWVCAECGEAQDGEPPQDDERPLTDDEIEDQKLMAKDYEAWSRT